MEIVAAASRRSARAEQGGGRPLGAAFQAGPFASPGGCQPDGPLASVDRIGPDGHEVLALELAEQSAQVAGVEPQPAAEVDDPGRAAAQLEEEAGRSERPPGVEIGVAEHADAPSEGPIEPAKNSDLVVDHDP